MPKATDIAKAEETSLAPRPDYIKAGTAGREHITRDDIQMPRLALAQSLSPELDESNAKYIDGLKLGHMFNSLTGENYKTGPIEFHILRADPPRFVEFNPREQGGGVKDLNVPPGDPRTQFTTGEQGERLPPVATKFYDFIILMLPWNEADPMDNIVVLSFKSSGLKIARQLNMRVQKRGADIFTGRYSVTTADEQNSKGKFKNFAINNAGWATPEQLSALEEMHNSLKDQTVVVHREGADVDETDTSFDPSSM